MGLLFTIICQGSIIFVFGLFETMQLVSHLPLVTVQMPTILVTFLKPLNDLMRLNFIYQVKVEKWLIDFFGIYEDGLSLQTNFNEFGYKNVLFLPNTVSIFAALSIIASLAIVIVGIDFILDRLQKRVKVIQ